jgi:hypothetical protein
MSRHVPGILAILLTLCTTAARGSVFARYRFMGTVTDGTTSASGYYGFVISLHSDSGNITAVDFSGPRGFQGPMVQRWTSSAHDGTYDTPTPGFSTDQNLASSPGNFDSHFLGVSANHVIGVALNETAVIDPPGTTFETFPPNTNIAGIGLGTRLQAAYGLDPVIQSPDLDVAYIVCKSDVVWTAQVATTGGTFDISSFGIPIPEPSSLSLVSLGILSAISRRRRR